MAIVIAGSSSYTPTGNQDVSTTGATIPLPTGLAVGEYVVAAVYYAQYTGAAASIVIPAGWTVITTTYGTASNRVVALYGYRINNAAALTAIGTTFQVKAGASATRIVANVHRLTGVDLSAAVSLGTLEFSAAGATTVTFNQPASGATKLFFLGTNNSSPSLPPVIGSTGGTVQVTNRSVANAGPTADSQLTTLIGGTGATYSVSATNHVSYGLGFTPLAASVVKTTTSAAVFATSMTTAITAPAIGNGLVLVVQHQAPGSVTVTDDASNTWTRRSATETVGATSQYRIDIWDCQGSVIGTAPTTVTATAGTSSEIGMTIYETTGLNWQAAAAAYNVSSPTSGAPAITPAVGDLIITSVGYYNGSNVNSGTVGSPYVTVVGSGATSTRYDSAYLIAAVTTASTPTWAVPGSSFGGGFASSSYGLAASPASNIPPTTSFTHSESGVTTTVTSTSTDSDGTIASYDWDWGDGTTHGATVTTTHTYVSAGAYTVTLTVTDNNGGTGTAIHTVMVGSATTPPTRKGYSLLNPGVSGASLVLDPSTVTSGTGISDNDWMVVTIVTSSATTSVTAPAGWTTLRSLTSIGTLRYAVYGKIRASGDTNYTYTLDTGGTTSAGSLMWGGGADTTVTNWLVGANTDRSVDLHNTGASITTSVDHSLILGISVERTTAIESAITSVSGATEWYFMPQAGGQIETIDVAYVADKTPAGATTVIDWTYPNTQAVNGMAMQLAIPPGLGGNISVGYPGVLRVGTTNYNGKLFYWDGSGAHDFTATPIVNFQPATVTQFLSPAHSPWFSAHRGFSYSYPEETLYAYRSATDWGIQAIEVSVQKSQDGTFWCFHDSTTTRTTGFSGTISSMTDATIAGLTNIGSTAASNPSQPARPTAKLADVLNIYAATHVIIIEDKTYANTTAMLNLMDSYGTSGRPASEIFIWKADALAGASFYTAAAARGYHRWGYIFDTSMASSYASVVASGKMDMIGMDFNSSDATLTSAIALAITNNVRPTGHIISSTTQRDRMLGLGMTGLMISNKAIVPPWYNTW